MRVHAGLEVADSVPGTRGKGWQIGLFPGHLLNSFLQLVVELAIECFVVSHTGRD